MIEDEAQVESSMEKFLVEIVRSIKPKACLKKQLKQQQEKENYSLVFQF